MTARQPVMQSWLPVVALALVTVSAGCLSSPPSSPTPTPTLDPERPDPMAAAFTLQECFMPVVLTAVPVAYQDAMPDGFTIVSDDLATATIEYRGLTCGRTDSQEAETGLLSAAWRVSPPPEYKDAAITDYEMSDGGYVQGEILGPLVSWGNNTPLLFIEAAVTSTHTPVGGAAATGFVEATTNNITVTLDWSSAGEARQSGRTYRLFLVNSLENPFRLVGAIDITVSDSNLLPTGTGYIQAQGRNSLIPGALPAKGATLHSNFTVQMRPAPLSI